MIDGGGQISDFAASRSASMAPVAEILHLLRVIPASLAVRRDEQRHAQRFRVGTTALVADKVKRLFPANEFRL
jgi:hypothetical protein